MSETELLPCPFCDRHLVNPSGYSAVVMVHPEPYENCPAWGIVVHTDMPERVAAWNRRVPLTAALSAETEAWEAADYLIHRLDTVTRGVPVRDLPEAWAHYVSAKGAAAAIRQRQGERS